jgi:hypothetical protein
MPKGEGSSDGGRRKERCFNISTFKTKINMLNSFATPSINKILHTHRRRKTM